MKFPLTCSFSKASIIFLFLLVLSFYAFSQPPSAVKLTPMQGMFSTAKKAESIRPVNWIDFNHPVGAFAVKLPGQPQEINQEVPNTTHPDYPPYKINMYLSPDSVNLVNYLIRYNDYPTGMYLADKAVTLDAICKEFMGKGEVVKTPDTIFKDGYEGRALDMIVQNNYMELKFYVRGNRIYLLMRQNVGNSKPAVNDAFFDSFRFEKYIPVKGVPFAVGNIELIMPNKPLPVPEGKTANEARAEDNKCYYAVNMNTGGAYAIEQTTLSKYLRVKEIDSIYAGVLDELKSGTDSIGKIVNVNIGMVKGKEYYSKDPKSGNGKRTRIWVHQDQFYFQTVIAGEEEISSPEVNGFFDSVKHKAVSKVFDLKSSKAKLILDDLQLRDTTVHKKALAALYNYAFDKDELQVIHAALKNNYADDTLQNGVRMSLISVLGNLHNEQTVPLLKAMYNDAKNPDLIRAQLLAKVPEIDKNSYDWYFNALSQNVSLKIKASWSLFNPLRDSLSYTSNHMDKFLGLLDSKVYRSSVLDILSDMVNIENKPKYLSLVESKKDRITAGAIRDLDQFITDYAKDKSTGAGPVFRYLDILPEVNLPKLTDEFTKKLFAVDSIPYLHTTALAARIRAGLPLDTKVLNAQLDSLDTRYDIMTAYYHAGKLDQVPAKYKKHDEFAKLLLYNYLAEDNDYPNTIALLGNLKNEQETYYVFSFSYLEDDVKKEYIGLSGPFDDEDAAKLNFDGYHCYVTFEPKNEDWKEQARAMITAMKEELKSQ
jgi:hypothetical protein